MNFSAVTKVLREVHQEPGGSLSWGRVASSFLLISAIAWVTHLILKTGGLPPLDGLTTFVISPYASNKVSAAVQSFGNPTQPNNNTPKV